MANLYLFCILLSIKGRIEKIDILLVHLFLRDLQALAEVINLSKLLYPLHGKWYWCFRFELILSEKEAFVKLATIAYA